MNKNIFFIGGIHGVGKSYFCKKVSSKFGIKHYSASDLIKLIKSDRVQTNKQVSDLDGNQDVLIAAINAHVKEDTILLDGHFCLFDNQNNIQKIPADVFKELAPKAILIIRDDVKNILERINKRDSLGYDELLFNDLQNSELNYSEVVSKYIQSPIYSQVAGTINEDFLTLIKNTIERPEMKLDKLN